MPMDADPDTLAVACPRCGKAPLKPCTNDFGERTHSHAARVRAGKAAAEARRDEAA